MRRRRDSIFKVGVTGPIGGGKSTLCEEFLRAGIPVIAADDLAKEVLQSGETPRAVAKAVGGGVLRADGTVDTAALARTVFSNPSKLAALKKIIHPVVFKIIDAQFCELASRGEPAAAIEAALIYESRFDRQLNFVIVVDAPREERIRRAAARLGVPPSEIEMREAGQMPADEKAARADLLINNRGSPSELRTQAAFAARLVRKMAESKGT